MDKQRKAIIAFPAHGPTAHKDSSLKRGQMSNHYEEELLDELEEQVERPIEHSVVEIETSFGLLNDDAGIRLLTAVLNFLTSQKNLRRR